MLDTLKIIKQYYSDNPPLYDLLLKHSKQVADLAMLIARKNKFEDVDLDFLYEAASLHDIGIFLCDAPAIHCFGTHQYIEHGYLGAELLRKDGLDRHALVCERHTGVGFAEETIIKKRLPLPHRDMLPISLEEEIICYADKFFSKSSPNKQLTTAEIRANLAKHGLENVAVFDAWHQRFGHDLLT